jgi:predicted esterase
VEIVAIFLEQTRSHQEFCDATVLDDSSSLLPFGKLGACVLAFSPGFLSLAHSTGQPHIYIAHGIHDTVLPINHCSRRIVSRLQHDHYDVTYHEFDGSHTVPIPIVLEAWSWFMETTKQEE